MTGPTAAAERLHSVSVVIPVYQGAGTLAAVVEQLRPLTAERRSGDGHLFRVAEILLVYDHGPDRSAEVMRDLAADVDAVRTVWLSRNFGQHAATLAGMASSGGDWIVTLDEDGLHDPADIPRLLDVALAEQATVVYAAPVNPPPHGRLRNAASALTKAVFTRLLANREGGQFQSYRLVLGEVGRSVAAYAGAGVFLDVALSWVTARTAACPVRLRDTEARPSGYSYRRLLSHFWRMVVTSGTRGLRLVSGLGLLFALVGFGLAVFLVVARLRDATVVPGWTSVIVVVLLGTGLVLFSLGVVAEYLGVAVNMAMGKPPYLVVQDPADGPLGAPRPLAARGHAERHEVDAR